MPDINIEPASAAALAREVTHAEQDAQRIIAHLKARIERMRTAMLSNASRPRIIVGAVAIEEARRNKAFAADLLAAMDRGSDRLVDLRTVVNFVGEIESKWQLADRPTNPNCTGTP